MRDGLDPGKFAADHAARLLERLAQQANSTLHSKDADSVHDLRVAIRRFAQVLAVFKPSFPARVRRKIRRRLKEIMAFAGDVRDRDIAIGLLAHSRSVEAAALQVRLSAQRKEAEAVLVAVLRRWGAKRSLLKWRADLLPVETAAAEPERVLVRMAEKFIRAGDQAAEANSSVGDLHRFRILAKKFRYSVELFRPVYGAAADEWLGRMKRLQTVLGDMNDYRVARELIADLGANVSLAASFKRKEQKKAAEFRDLWKEEYSAAAREWARSLERVPRKPVGRAAAPRKTLTLAAH
jgi:CHAD domain-containing protein